MHEKRLAGAVPQKWLAQRLSMKSAANVSQQLRRGAANGQRCKLPVSLQKSLLSVKI
jgi:hypothetical protein